MDGVISLRRCNNFLAAIVIALAGFIFVWPILPSLMWWTHYQAPIISRKLPTTIPVTGEDVPKNNTLIIPKLNMREEINDGPDLRTLRKGVWHLPETSSPDKEGNTIMAGHRFTYSGKAVFYYLDKVSVNDNIYVYWHAKRYDYVVTAVNVVPPTDETLIAPTNTPTLTVYTCTPLWSAKNRLVITAKLAEAH